MGRKSRSENILDSISCFRFEVSGRTCVTSGEPLHSVDSRLTMVDTWLLSLASGAEGAAPVEVRPGLQEEAGPDTVPPAAAIRDSSSSVKPCLAKGAGSTPRRVNLSANEAKQRSAPSDTLRTGNVSVTILECGSSTLTEIRAPVCPGGASLSLRLPGGLHVSGDLTETRRRSPETSPEAPSCCRGGILQPWKSVACLCGPGDRCL